MKVTTLDRDGFGFIASHEAIYLYAYPDPGTGAEPWTIGMGHTSPAGPPAVRRGDRLTLEQALRVARQDMRKFSGRVVGRLGPQPQNRLNALTSFDFNTGAIIKGSVDDKLLRGDVAGAMATMRQYRNAGGRVMAGLVRRRDEEVALFLRGTYPNAAIAIREAPGARARYVKASSLPWDNLPAPPVVDIKLPPKGEVPPLPTRKRENFLIDLFWVVVKWLSGKG